MQLKFSLAVITWDCVLLQSWRPFTRKLILHFCSQTPFDHLTSQLLVKIAKQSDLSTRGCVVRNKKLTKTIYGQYPHKMKVDRVEFSRLHVGTTVYNRIIIVDSPFTSEIYFTENTQPQSKYLSQVCQIGDFFVSDMECGNYSVGNVLSLFSTLKVVKRMSFDNCYFLFTETFLADTCEKYNVKKMITRCPSVLNVNVQSVINDKFFSSYRGDFQFTVTQKKDMSKTKSLITDQTLQYLAKYPKKVFQLENIRCQYTSPCLVGTVEAVIRNNLEVDWDLGVLVVGSDELSYFHDSVQQTLAEAASTVNGNLERNLYYIAHDGETYFEEYAIKSERSQIKFTLQLDSGIPTTSRKRPYKSTKTRQSGIDN